MMVMMLRRCQLINSPSNAMIACARHQKSTFVTWYCHMTWCTHVPRRPCKFFCVNILPFWCLHVGWFRKILGILKRTIQSLYYRLLTYTGERLYRGWFQFILGNLCNDASDKKVSRRTTFMWQEWSVLGTSATLNLIKQPWKCRNHSDRNWSIWQELTAKCLSPLLNLASLKMPNSFW